MSDRYFFSEVIFIMRPQREPTISILFDHFFLLEETDTQIITYIFSTSTQANLVIPDGIKPENLVKVPFSSNSRCGYAGSSPIAPLARTMTSDNGTDSFFLNNHRSSDNGFPVFFLSLIPSPKFCPVRRVLPIITKVYRSKTSLFPSYVLNLSVVI